MADYNLDIHEGQYLVTGDSFHLDQSDRPIQCYTPWIDIERLAVLTGETDEDNLDLLVSRVGALVDAYLERAIRDCTHTDLWSKVQLRTLQAPMVFLKNWPLTEVHSIRFDGERYPLEEFSFDLEYGMVYPSRNTITAMINTTNGMTINYRSGFSPTPLEVQTVFEEMVIRLYNQGGAGNVGDVKKASLVGLGSVEFATTNTYAGVDQQLGVPELIKPYTGVLDRYKSDRAIGVIV